MKLKMNKKLVLPILVIFMSIFSASAATVTVNSGESIQNAVDHASSADSILVRSGVYNEQVVIDKSLNIIGDTESGAAILKGGIILNAEGITVEGFRITGTDEGLLVKSNNNIIKNNIVVGNKLGIKLTGKSNKIFNNYFDNSQNVQDSGGNQWNGEKTDGLNIIGGIYLGGNFWSGYSGTDTDNDGIGDNPYIEGSVIDALPLVNIAAVPQQINITLPPINEVTPSLPYRTENKGVDIVAPLPFDLPLSMKIPGIEDLPSPYAPPASPHNISQPSPVYTPLKVEGPAPTTVSTEEAALREQLNAARHAGDMSEVMRIEGQLEALQGTTLSQVQANEVSANAGLAEANGGPAHANDVGVKWALNDILVAGTKFQELNPNIVHDSDGTLYIAVERDTDNTTQVYRSFDNGNTWYSFYWFCGGTYCTIPLNNPKLAIGYGPASTHFLMLAVGGQDNWLRLFRVNLTSNSWDSRGIEYSSSGIYYPAIVTDTAEYGSAWYGYLVYNSYNGTSYNLKFTRTFDKGGNWSAPTVLHGSPYSYYAPDIDYGNGNLYVAFDDYISASRNVYLLSSTGYSFGATWNPISQITWGSNNFMPEVAASKNDAGNKTAVISYTSYSSYTGYDAQFALTQNGSANIWYSGYCFACTTDSEYYPAITVSDRMGTFYAVYGHNSNFDFKSAAYKVPWYLQYGGIDGISSSPTVYAPATITTNPTKSQKDEAGIAWADSRNYYSGSLYDVYFDGPSLPGDTGGCYDYTLSQWITPPSWGWYVSDNIECNSTTITLNGSLQIYGKLSFNNVTLKMNVSDNGQYSIDTYSGSTFHINDLNGVPSTITNGNVSNAYYTFRVNQGTDFEIHGSRVKNAGYAYNLDTAGNNYNDAGLWINANNTIIEGSEISNNHFMGVIFYNSNGNRITNSYIHHNDWDGIYGINSNNNYLANTYVTYNGWDGILISGGDNTFFSNLVYYNGEDGFSVSGVNNAFLNNIYAYGNGRHGFVVSGTNSTISNTYSADYNGDTGIVVISNNCTIKNNNVKYNYRGILLSSSTGCIIQNNYLYGNKWRGIDLESSPNNLLNKNTALQTGGLPDSAGIILVYSPSNNVTGNTANNNAYYGIRSWNSPLTTINMNIANSNGAGIYLENSSSSKVNNNTALNNSGGIGLSGTDLTDVTNNNASSNGNGISLSSSDYNFIFNNTAQGNSFGISMSGSNNNNVTQNKNVEKNSNYGIFAFNSHYNNITRNNMNNSGSIGVHLEGSNYNNVLWNYAQNSGNYGFDLFNSNYNNVSMNDGKASHDIGVGLSSSNSNIVTNNIVQGNSIGISMRWSNNNDVERNIALLDNIGLFMFQSGGNTVVANTVSKNNNEGMELSISDNNGIRDNIVNENGNYGIHAYSSKLNQLKNNTLLSNGVGVYLDWSTSNDIINNRVNLSKINGIALVYASDSNNVSSNTANTNGNISIKVSSSKNNMIENNIAMYSDIGIFLDWSKNNFIRKNTANNNDIHGISLEWFSDNNRITDNKASNNIVGLSFMWSSNNIAENNTLTQNNLSTNLEWSSNNNILRNNTMRSNNYGASVSWSSENNTLTGNWIDSNALLGLYLRDSDTNLIYNNYIANSNNAWDNSANKWNISKTAGTNIIGGPYLGGNFWSDYSGKDLDGDRLGDTNLPYNNNITVGGDYRPLTSLESRLPLVYVSPDYQKASVGSNITVTIEVNPLGNNVYAASYNLSFDPSELEALTQTKGPFLTRDGANSTIVLNNIDNTNGILSYAETRVGTLTGTNIADTITTVKFRVKSGSGNTSLTITQAQLTDPVPAVIPSITKNGLVDIGGSQPVANCGPDKLKCENVGTPIQFNGSASYDPDGSIVNYAWDFGDGTAGSGVTPKHKYTAYKWNGTAYQPFIVNLTVTDNIGLTNTVSQKVVIWIAGDANGQGGVNILDASLVGLRWGTGDACADLNNDGVVNIIDAAIIGLNWGRTP